MGMGFTRLVRGRLAVGVFGHKVSRQPDGRSMWGALQESRSPATAARMDTSASVEFTGIERQASGRVDVRLKAELHTLSLTSLPGSHKVGAGQHERRWWW
jgi:hypothetical protein